MEIALAVAVVALVAGAVAVHRNRLRYQQEVLKLKFMQQGAEYQAGFRAGMLKAADLLRSGKNAASSGPFTPSPAALAKMIEGAAPPESPEPF